MSKKKQAKKNKPRPMPTLKNEDRTTVIPDPDQYEKITDLRVAVAASINALLNLKMIRRNTQREETLRSFVYCLPRTGTTSSLPFYSHGIGWLRNDKMRCLLAEVSCMVVAFWDYVKDPCAVNEESVTDFIEYLADLCEDEETIQTIDMGKGCRWRITNDRIKNGCKMVED